MKLAHREVHSEALVSWLNKQADLVMVSSVIVEIELNRALLRYDREALARVPEVLARLVRVELDPTIRAIAAAYQNPTLRSLDAVHLATASHVSASGEPGIEAFVTYDARLGGRAASEHFRVVAPGGG